MAAATLLASSANMKGEQREIRACKRAARDGCRCSRLRLHLLDVEEEVSGRKKLPAEPSA